MSTIYKKRSALRAMFTKVAKGFSDLLTKEDVDVNEVKAKFLILENYYLEIESTNSEIINSLLEESEESNGKILSEMEAADEYKMKFLYLKSTFENLSLAYENSKDLPDVTSQISESKKNCLRYPKLELVKYGGDISNWISFWAQFSHIHDDESLSKEEKFQYLIQATIPGSRARLVVESYPPSGENYDQAINSLKERFGRKDLLVEFYIRQLLGLVTSRKETHLSVLYDRLTTQIHNLETLGIMSDSYAAILFPLIESCIPIETLRVWQRSVTDRSVSFKLQLEALMNFLKGEVEGEERLALATKGRKMGESLPAQVQVKNFPTANSLVNNSNKQCIFCFDYHSPIDCLKAKTMSLTEKRLALSKGNRCFNCTNPGHTFRQCKSRCAKCKGSHIALMCPGHSRETVNRVEVDLTANDDHSLAVFHSPPSAIYLQTFVVFIRNGDRMKKARVLIDSGSQHSYVCKEVIQELGYMPEGEEHLCHTLFGGSSTGQVKHLSYKLHLQSTDNSFACSFLALDQDVIACNIPSVSWREPWMEELRKYHIQLIPDRGGPVQILIGADVAGKVWTGQKKILSTGLVAMHTHFGWTLMGTSRTKSDCLQLNTDNTLTMLNIRKSEVTSLWDLDVIGITDPVETKKKEERHAAILEEFNNNVRFIDGRYEVKLPWKEDRASLPDNKPLVVGRLHRCVHKLKRNNNLLSEYDSVLRGWLEEDIIEETHDADHGYYLPHRPVIKESSTTTKIRPVFDASATIKGFPSLNECLEEGPNLIELLHVTLMRFREKKIGISADIKKAFLQIGIHPDDRDCLKFLWWNDVEDRMITFRHKRVVFGVTSSPFLLAAVLMYHFNKCMEVADKQSKAILKLLSTGFYVDNLATSIEDCEGVKYFEQKSCEILRAAGFDLRGWETSYEKTNSPETSILGIKWNRERDILKINMEWWEQLVLPRDLTKRNVFSIGQRLFDPIGITIPVTIQLKFIVQELWTKKLDWDDNLDEEMQANFDNWLNKIHWLREIEVNRCLGAGGNKSVHLFCDASQKAYAAAIFLRSELDDEVSVELLQAKSRVKPLKEMSIPRMELMAATIGARLLKTVLGALEWKDIQTFLWTDSSTVLAWIQRKEEWSVFVRNRIREIRELTPIDRWRHLPGNFNPADLPSRGCTADKLLQSRWWEGPSWLKSEESEWPISRVTHFEEDKIGIERVKTSSSYLTVSSDHSSLYKYFSKFEQIIRMVAWMCRFCNNARCKEGRINGPLTITELEVAKIIVFRSVQEEVFQSITEERIAHLRPFIDGCGVVRVKTKLLNREDCANFKYPSLLPGTHPVVERMLYDLHCKSHHVGPQTLLGLARQQCWIINGRLTARRIVKNCVICRRFNSKAFDTESPPLPEPRVRDAPAFQVTGVDLAGPLILKNGNKVWICLFTCAIYRAIHMELVTSLSTNALILALRRFVARRGRPDIIYSDNGTNFRGADNFFSSITWEDVKAFCDVERIDWRFNPPSAPWWGGFWERMVRMVKQVLRKTLRKASLNLEELYTIICDCEAVINSRPLTPISDTNSDPEPLTPAMFIQGVQHTAMPDCDIFEKSNLNRRLKYRQRMMESLRKRFRLEYLGLLTWSTRRETREPQVGEVVLIAEDDKRRLNWPLAVIEEIVRGRDGRVRVLKLKNSSGFFTRPIQRVHPLEETKR